MFLYQQQKGSLTGKVSRTSAVVHFQCAALIRRMHSIESIGNDSWLCASLTSTKQYLGNRGDYLGSSRTPNRSTVDGFLRISLRKGTWWRHLSCNGDMPCTASNAFSGDVQVCRLQLGLFENDRHSWATWTRKFWSACLSVNSTIAARPKYGCESTCFAANELLPRLIHVHIIQRKGNLGAYLRQNMST